MRPSHGQVSYQKVANIFLGQEAVRSCAVPMCRSPVDIRLFVSGLTAQKPWLSDRQVCSHYIARKGGGSLKEIVLWIRHWRRKGNSDSTSSTSNGDYEKALLVAGHEVIDFILTEHIETAKIITKMWDADGGEEFQRDTNRRESHFTRNWGHGSVIVPQSNL